MKNCITLLSLSILILHACTSSNTGSKSKSDDAVLAKVGNESVYNSEFDYVYGKNNATAEDAYTASSINEYLELYLNFRLKVKEAKELGLDTLSTFKNELSGYREQVAKQYLTEEGVIDELAKLAYDRMQEEVEVSHILLKIPPQASPDDTLKKFNKALDIVNKVKSGEDFGKLAKENSDDIGSANKMGYLGFFTALNFVYPFETAAYNTKVGDITKPVRSDFGYHIIKVHSKRKSQGIVEISHIMIKSNPGIEKEDSIAAKRSIDEIYTKAISGGNWGDLVSQYSEDGTSNSTGGKMSFKLRSTRVPDFEEAAFALKVPGDISEPVFSGYGWHIIKLIEKKPIESFDVLKENLTRDIRRKHGSKISDKRLQERLRKENNFEENKEGLNVLYSLIDSTILKNNWNYDSTDKKINTTLFSISNENYTIKTFLDYFKSHVGNKRKRFEPTHLVSTIYIDFVNKTNIQYEEDHLDEKYLEFKLLINEYHDGILLFQLMDEKVWSKAIIDTSGIKSFFEKNRDKYNWDFRAQAKIYSVKDHGTLELLMHYLETDTARTEKDIIDELNKKDPLSIKVTEGFFSKGENKILDEITWKEGSTTIEKDGWLDYIIISKIEGPRKKTLNEARGLVISDYQNFLEKEWVEKLKKKYPIQTYPEAINKLVK